MTIHLFGSSTPVGSYFSNILKKRDYKNVLLYSRKHTKSSSIFCDMQNPIEFLEKKPEEETIIVSFVPIWITSKFLSQLLKYNPEFFFSVKKIIVCSSSSFWTKRFSFNKADKDLYYKLERSQINIIKICNSYNIDLKIVQPTLVYGSYGKYKDKNFSLLIKIMRIFPFLILPKNNGLRQPISCFQLAHVFLKLIENNDFFNKNLDPILSVGGDQVISYKQMLELIKVSLSKNDLAKNCILIIIPDIVFLLITSPLIIFSFKIYESVLRIFADLAGFTLQSEVTKNLTRTFPDKEINYD